MWDDDDQQALHHQQQLEQQLEQQELELSSVMQRLIDDMEKHLPKLKKFVEARKDGLGKDK